MLVDCVHYGFVHEQVIAFLVKVFWVTTNAIITTCLLADVTHLIIVLGKHFFLFWISANLLNYFLAELLVQFLVLLGLGLLVQVAWVDIIYCVS